MTAINRLPTEGNDKIPIAASNNSIHVPERKIYLCHDRKKLQFPSL